MSKKQDQLKDVATLVGTLMVSEFYGSVTVNLVKGEVTIVRVEQTIKLPLPKGPSKPFKEMTAQEYLDYQRQVWDGKEA